MIRFFDVLLSIILIAFLLPVFIIISILITITSGFPILFKQQRVGRYNKDFTIFKFRTMHNNSDKKGLLTIGNTDSRITAIGKFLRQYKLDELPQLFNVLIGNMSFVGPRPEVRYYVNYYTSEQQQILKVKPGITDYATIAYKNETELLKSVNNPEQFYISEILPKKIELNKKFINSPSLSNYFKILFKTIKVLLKNK